MREKDDERMCVEYDIYKGFTVIDDFPFMAIRHPWNVHDAIIIHEMDDINFRRDRIPKHSIEEYVEFINERKILIIHRYTSYRKYRDFPAKILQMIFQTIRWITHWWKSIIQRFTGWLI